MLWWVCYKKCFSKVGFWNKFFFSSPLHIEHFKLYVLLLSPRWYFPFFVFIDQKSTRFCINSHISAVISYPIPNPLKSETDLFENRPPKSTAGAFEEKTQGETKPICSSPHAGFNGVFKISKLFFVLKLCGFEVGKISKFFDLGGGGVWHHLFKNRGRISKK